MLVLQFPIYLKLTELLCKLPLQIFQERKEVSHFVETGVKKKPKPQQQQKNNTCENVNELPYFTMSVECSK